MKVDEDTLAFETRLEEKTCSKTIGAEIPDWEKLNFDKHTGNAKCRWVLSKSVRGEINPYSILPSPHYSKQLRFKKLLSDQEGIVISRCRGWVGAWGGGIASVGAGADVRLGRAVRWWCGVGLNCVHLT